MVLAVIAIIIAIIVAIKGSVHDAKIKKILTDNIVNSVITEVFGENVEYIPNKFVKPGNMVFPFKYDRHEGSDYIKTTYHGLDIELSDISLLAEVETMDENGNVERDYKIECRGQWLIWDFGKELVVEVYVSQINIKDGRKLYGNVSMDNEIFSNRFSVKADDPQEAFYILTPHMREYITKVSDSTNGGLLYLAFSRDGKLQVYVNSGRDFFEFGDKDNADANALHEKYLQELHFFTDIIDTLRVEDTIYKK